MKLKMKKVNVDAGEFTVILNMKNATEMGVRSLDRVKVITPHKTIVAIVETTKTVIGEGEVGVLCKAYEELRESQTDEVMVLPTQRPQSVEFIKKKIDGKVLTTTEMYTIISDITQHQLSDTELTAFLVSTHLQGMNLDEVTDMTKAMVETGATIELDREPVFDFHSIGGVPGNKVTLLVVPIVAAAGLVIPKTCSRAISSACGTADILESIARVSLTKEEIKYNAETVGGTIAWGGAVDFAPADDMIIRVEYPLSLDPYSQVIASVLAKKKAVGADYFLLDIPTGPGTKVPDLELANRYAMDFIEVGKRLGIAVDCAITYGGQPIGKHIGPRLETQEALLALEGNAISSSVVEKSVSMAGIILEMGGLDNGKYLAREILASGKALAKMKEIIGAQDGDPDITSADIPPGKFITQIISQTGGYITALHNKALVRVARAAGAPRDKGAGLVLLKKRGDKVDRGEAVLEIHSDNKERLEQARRLAQHLRPFTIEGMVLEHIRGQQRAMDFSGDTRKL